MCFEEIAELIQYIPKDSRHFTNLIISDFDSRSENSYEVELFAACYRDFAFRWHFVRSLVDSNQKLPTKIKDKFIQDLYKYETSKVKNKYLTLAIGISKSMPAVFKNTLMGMLLSTDASYEKIAGLLGMAVEVIVYFEKIFFNVVDRFNDALYISAIPYPEGRVGEMVSGENYQRNPLAEIVKSGYNNGIDHVAFASGLRSNLVSEDFTTMAKKLENLVMSNGYFLARNGFLNTYTPGLQHAKQIIAATKQGDANDSTTEDFGPSLMSSIIMGELETTMAKQVAIKTKLLKQAEAVN